MIFQTAMSMQSVQSEGARSKASVAPSAAGSTTGRQVFTTVGIYDGQVVAVKSVKRTNPVALTRPVLVDLKLVC